MQLILWRHCDAEDGAPDELRRLSARGRDDASRMARWLLQRLPADCRIVVSPALRAQQTAAALGRAFETVAGLAPGATVDDVLRIAGWPGDVVTTLVVGHEPTLGDVASQLLDGDAGGRHLHKGAVVWLAPRDAGDATAILEATAHPGSIGR
jgi:phosphohistidine phosphatase